MEKRPRKKRVALLHEIAGALHDLTEHFKETTPEGIDIVVFEGTVNPPAKRIHLVNEYPYHKLFTIDVINNGPNTAYVKVNDENEISINVDETIPFQKPKAKIEYIDIRLSGSTALKIIGHY